MRKMKYDFEGVPWVKEMRAEGQIAAEEKVILALDIRQTDSKDRILNVMVGLHGPSGRADSKSLLDEMEPGAEHRLLMTRVPGKGIQAKLIRVGLAH